MRIQRVIVEHMASVLDLSNTLRVSLCEKAMSLQAGSVSRRYWEHLDGLRVAGKAAITFVLSAIEDDNEVASVVALLLAESETDQPIAPEKSAALLLHESPDIRKAAWWGLRLASFRYVEPHLRALLGKPKWDFASAAALDILAFHRLPVQVELGALPDEEGDEIACLIAEAGGRIPGAWNATRLKQFLGHASSRVREAALRASARCGLSELPAVCREAISRLEPVEAIECLGVVGSPEDIRRLQRTVTDSPVANPPVAKAAVDGMGRLGLPACVPFLLDLMDSPELAESAATAFWRITGQEAARGPAQERPPGLTEDELDLWEPHPPVDVSRTRDWWKSNDTRFDPAKRYQIGLNVTDNPLGSVFDQLPLGIRYDVYLRERALTPGTPDWELETWPWMQKSPGTCREPIRPHPSLWMPS